MLRKCLTHPTMKLKDHYPQKKKIKFMKDELAGKQMKRFVDMSPKVNSCLRDEGLVGKNTKGTTKCVTKRETKLQNYRKCLEKNETILKSKQRFMSAGY